MTFGEYVKTTRKSLGLSMYELSAKSKVSRPTISRIEAEKHKTTEKVRRKLEEVLKYMERNQKKPASLGVRTIYPVKCYKLSESQIEYYRTLPVYVPIKGYRYWEYEAEHDQWKNEVFEK